MAKIIGIEHCSFKTKDGETISDDRIHYTEPVDARRGVGEAGDHFFLSTERLAALSFTPAPNQEVELRWNRYGKVISLTLLGEIMDIG